MINIRRGCFETNSSSMHSLVITKPERTKEYTESELKFDYALREDRKTKKLTFELWNYCNSQDLCYERSPFQILRTPLEKLRYYCAATLMNYTGKPDKKKVKEIKNFIMKYTGITNPKDIKLYLEDEHTDWKSGRVRIKKNYGAVYANDSGETPMHFILRKGITLEDLVMNPKYTIIVDGDESCLFKGLFEAGIINANDFEDISTNKSFWNDDIYECSYYFYMRNLETQEAGEDIVSEIAGDVLSYQHTFKLRIDLFEDFETYAYSQEAINNLVKAIRAKRPDIKVILSFYNYERDKNVKDFDPSRYDWDLSLFDSVEYESREDEDDEE